MRGGLAGGQAGFRPSGCDIGCCAVWSASVWSAQHEPGCTHSPALGKSQKVRGTPPETPGREGESLSALSLSLGGAFALAEIGE